MGRTAFVMPAGGRKWPLWAGSDVVKQTLARNKHCLGAQELVRCRRRERKRANPASRCRDSGERDGRGERGGRLLTGLLFFPAQLTLNGTRESEEANRLTTEDISDDDIELGGAALEDGFLQPYPAKRRRALLKALGVKKIDKEEKRELHGLRLSREDCGCDCQEFCDPETCGCSLAGIKCQVRGLLGVGGPLGG